MFKITLKNFKKYIYSNHSKLFSIITEPILDLDLSKKNFKENNKNYTSKHNENRKKEFSKTDSGKLTKEELRSSSYQKIDEENFRNKQERIILRNEAQVINIDNEKNFKGLLNECYLCMKYLNSNFSPYVLDTLSKAFINNIFIQQDYGNLLGVIHNSILEFDSYKKLEDNHLKQLSKNILNSFLIIYEFLDRGLKGFLTGDISTNLIQNGQVIFEKYLSEIKKVEENFIKIGIDPKEFYEAFFKIDRKFYEINNSRNLVSNISNSVTSTEGKNLLYHVNLKTTQFTDNYVKVMSKTSSHQEIVGEINLIKGKVQEIINELYNDIQTKCIINSLKTPLHGIPYSDRENQTNLLRRQLLIEEGMFDDATEEYLKLLNNLNKLDSVHNMAINQKILIKWNKIMNHVVAECQNLIIEKKEFKKKSTKYLEYFITLPSRNVSIICLTYLMRALICNTVTSDNNKDENFLEFLKLYEEGEEAIEIKLPLLNFAEDLGKLFLTELKNNKIENTVKDKEAKMYVKSLSENMIIYEVSKEEKIKLGMFLTHLMVKNLSYVEEEENLNILEIVSSKIDKFKTQNYVKFNNTFIRNYYRDIHKTFSLNSQIKKSLPMIYKPMNWKSLNIGAYYLRHSPFTKIKPDFKEASKLFDFNDTSRVMTVLDDLSKIGWRVNKKILDVMEFIWANGGGKGYIPKRFNERIITRDMMKNIDFKDKINLLKEAQTNRESHSLRCDFLIKLKVAQEFSKISKFYFPHNLDYRGRAYPISPHLNHMGSDVNRGILEYAESKRLGKSGLRWLKIHLANVIGKDKLPLDQREKYSESILETVHKCAKDPYRNHEWLESENPWQTLASMFELSAALKSPNPENYKTYLHCHVDGSCNGLQHYSALGRDYNGGYEVNLINRDRPGDVYTKVLDIVIGKLHEERDPSLKKFSEILLKENIVNRRVIKQTVMTSVYGVTLIGARDQIRRQLKETNVFDPQSLYYVSNYLAKITIQSIGDLFREANQIKEWLTKCALIISNNGSSVKWKTPLGLPCVQPYKRITDVDIIKTQSMGVAVSCDFDSQPVNARKQGSAFPPNYIHSLDSCHMMLTCNRAIKNDIVYSAVHDSFWAHPSDLDTLGIYIREEFVRLHSEPLLENLLKNFKEVHPLLSFPEIPVRGTLDLKEVLTSTYFFS